MTVKRRKILKKIKRSLKKYWFNYLFIIVISNLIIQYIAISSKTPYTFISAAIILGLLCLERFTKQSPLQKYLYLTISYTLFILSFYIYRPEIHFAVNILLIVTTLYFFLFQNTLMNIPVYIAAVMYPVSSIPYTFLPPLIGIISALTLNSVIFTIIITLLKKLTKEKIKYKILSTKDSLTNLHTLSYIVKTGNQLLKEKNHITILLLDMNNFKHINDTYGHMIGNKVLIQIAHFLNIKCKKINALPGRIGSDEFIIMVKNFSLNKVEKFTKEIFMEINDKHFELDPDIESVKLSFSIGRSSSDLFEGDADIDKLVNSATNDKYINKYGKNRLNNKIGSLKNMFCPQIYNFLNVLAEKDMYTLIHSEFTAQYAVAIAKMLNLDEESINNIYKAGWLHDIGKIFISNNILRKIGHLTAKEYKIMKKHPDYGMNILKKYDLPRSVINGILYHHEFWNGKGYLEGLKEYDIPLEGRIIKIADSFSAMIIKRVYRNPLSKLEALEEIKSLSGIHFDPELVVIFEKIILQEENMISLKQSDTSPILS